MQFRLLCPVNFMTLKGQSLYALQNSQRCDTFIIYLLSYNLLGYLYFFVAIIFFKVAFIVAFWYSCDKVGSNVAELTLMLAP